MAGPGGSEAPWELFTWPGVKGRGEYLRLVFEEAGVAYSDVGKQEGFAAVADFCWKGKNTGFPVRAPPAIRKGDFVLSYTPVLMAYLGRKFGLMPQGEEEAAHVEQILGVVTDAVAEGRLAFHPKDFYASHKIQVDESKPYVKQYGEQRLPKYMAFFEAVLQQNTHKGGFLVGASVTVADLAVYQCMAAAEQHYGPYYAAQETPLAKAHQAAIAARPRIAAYLHSERCQPWDSDSMM
ncbi:hypothetical protein HYH03_018076 [Edaphochlamys debaryana]|uniref:Glutathione S-transferase n=1 Tax=Edaphochlamys debaryana TaxID=47281 RepID=A0A835XEI3_9CHLO|nr:hypothetical protein HYH03_018076 [Edaphochlamys debaryana]|eukprot:KAG2483047.1 hypothetical protein HYH03_018076 [Edaphochlamys debaryana]